jgi:diacylglycerol kinase (ATP)
MKWMAIVNSRSAFKTIQERDRLLQSLSSYTKEVHFTRYSGHALELSRRAVVRGFDGIIAVGGDGTVHEILRSFNLQQQRLIVLPGGTGNSLTKDLGLTKSLVPPSLQEAHFASLDLIHVTCHMSDGGRFSCYSSSTVAVGYPADATLLANRYFKWLRGQCYAAASLLSLMSRSSKTYTVSYDGGEPEHRKVFGLLLSNTRHMGNFLCFPKAVPDDGKTDVIEMVAPLFSQLVHNLSVLTKTHFYDPTNIRTTRTARIDLPEPGLVMIDGEIYANVRTVETEILPRVLQVLANPTFVPTLPIWEAPPQKNEAHI